MKRILRILAIAAICGVLVAPQVEARGNRPSHSQSGGSQGRGNGGRSGGRANNPSSPAGSNTSHSRPGSPGGGNHNGGSRPGNGTGRPDGTRPGHNGNNGNHNGGNRPGSNPGHNPGRPNGPRPGHNGNNGNHNGGNRPGNNPGHNPGRPGNDFGHGGNRPGHNPGRPGDHRPGHPGGPHHFAPPPHRPHYAHPWAPPRPPRGWRPGRVYPTFSTVLGITFGSAFDISLAYLLNNGYNVYSYGNNIVYLNNVSQLNLLWPDASLYYGSRGLDRGEFIYSTSYYDTMRYNDAYARLVAAYGAPVSTTYPSNGMQTCWFGNNGRFVTLQFMPTYGADGIMRYYTTLSFGL